MTGRAKVVGQPSAQKCFIICPIGEPESAERIRSDKLLKHIITPVVEPRFKVIRPDKIAKPGVITDQIIQHLLTTPLVVADLTGSNPNVFYELAIRHATRKAFVQVIEHGERIPFDNFNMRTVQYGFDIEAVDRCKAELKEQVEDAIKNTGNLTSPISTSLDLAVLGSSKDPLQKTNAQILKMLQRVHADVSLLVEQRWRRPLGGDARLIEELLVLVARLAERGAFGRQGKGKADPETRMLLHRLSKLMEILVTRSGAPPEAFRAFHRLRELGLGEG